MNPNLNPTKIQCLTLFDEAECLIQEYVRDGSSFFCGTYVKSLLLPCIGPDADLHQWSKAVNSKELASTCLSNLSLGTIATILIYSCNVFSDLLVRVSGICLGHWDHLLELVSVCFPSQLVGDILERDRAAVFSFMRSAGGRC